MIGIILIICFGLRLISLNQSLWLDEAISANVAHNYNLIDTIKLFSVNDFHPPFYYLFLNVWGKIFGFSEISLRLPSVIFSLITIYFVYLIGKLVKNKKTGLWAAAIVGVNPLLIYFSQEARMYSLVTMFLVLALYNFLKIINSSTSFRHRRTGRIRNIIGINIFSFLSFITFYGAIFLIASFGIYFLIKKKFKLLLLTNLGIFLAVLVLFPLIKTQMQYSKQALKEVVNWNLVLGKVNLKNLFLIQIKFSIGRISFEPKILYYLIAGIWMVFIFAGVLWSGLKNKILLFLLFLPLILGMLFSFYSPLMQYFRFLYLVPIMSLLLAFVKNNNFKITTMVGFLIFSFYYLINPATHREDWKNLTRDLNNTPLYMISSVADPIKYYRPDIQISDVRYQIIEKEILVVPYAEEIHGIDHQKILSNQKYQKVEEKGFREVKIEKWKLQ